LTNGDRRSPWTVSLSVLTFSKAFSSTTAPTPDRVFSRRTVPKPCSVNSSVESPGGTRETGDAPVSLLTTVGAPGTPDPRMVIVTPGKRRPIRR